MKDRNIHELQVFVNAAPDAMVVVDGQGRISMVNQQSLELFGFTETEMINQPIEILIPDRYVHNHRNLRSQYTAEPKRRSMAEGRELTGKRKDGKEFPIEISLSPIEIREQKLILSSIRDITLRKVQENKFQALLESAPDGIIVVNSQGEITIVNGQVEKLFQYTRSELVGKKIEILVPDRLRPEHILHRNQYTSDARLRPIGVGQSLTGRRKDGSEFPVEISLSPLDTEQGKVVMSIIRDITESRRVKETLQATLDEKLTILQELERAMKIKDQFLATMSHELRTPLNAIVGFSGTLLMHLPGPLNDEQEKQLSTIQSSAKHLLTLINDILDLAKVEAGQVEVQLENVDCKAILRAVTDSLFQLAHKKGLKAEVVIPSSEVSIKTDRRMLTQILINLIGNAIKFTDSGGISVSLETELLDTHIHTVISVSDTGIGIESEKMESLFQAFVQLDSGPQRKAEGAGLGLHLSKKLASAINGTIHIESKYGSGTKAILKLKETRKNEKSSGH